MKHPHSRGGEHTTGAGGGGGCHSCLSSKLESPVACPLHRVSVFLYTMFLYTVLACSSTPR